MTSPSARNDEQPGLLRLRLAMTNSLDCFAFGSQRRTASRPPYITQAVIVRSSLRGLCPKQSSMVISSILYGRIVLCIASTPARNDEQPGLFRLRLAMTKPLGLLRLRLAMTKQPGLLRLRLAMTKQPGLLRLRLAMTNSLDCFAFGSP